MFKKIIGITILIGLVAVLIFGAINRTQAKAAQGERSYTGAIAGHDPQGSIRGRGNQAVRPNGGIIAGQVNRWSQTDDEVTAAQEIRPFQPGSGNGRVQENRFNQAGAGYSRGNGGGDPALGNPQAEVDEWINLEGEVTAVDTTLLTITLADGQVIEVYGRPWSYAQENGFSLQVGDRVLLTGFYEGATLEVGAIQNLATGSSIQIREENGRPLWAGRGRQG